MRRPFKWDKKYLYWGVTAFCVIALSIAFYMLLRYIPAIGEGLKKLVGILSPFIWGFAFSYLLAPLMRVMEKKFPKWLCVLICILIILIVIIALVWMLIPQLYSSLETIIINSPSYFEKMTGWIEKVMHNHPAVEETLTSMVGTIDTSFNNLLQTQIMPKLGNAVSNLTTGVVSVVKAVLNLVIGIIVSAYILATLDKVGAGGRKVLYSIFTIEAAEKIRSGIAFIDKTFKGFLNGKLLDSLIIGLLCYFFCAIVDMPYAVLVSVIVGITNIIPFFGPFIGAIPSAIIILMVNPVKCLVFVVFIIILQQIDGNVIGPKILGSSIGISSFWVMFSIIVGGGIFGFWGMLLGVPVFVCIYTGIKSLIDKKLERSDLPTDDAAYEKLDEIDPVTRELKYKEK